MRCPECGQKECCGASLAPELDALRKHAEDLYDAARAHQELNVCYRMTKRPSDKLFKRLDKARHALDAYRAACPKEDSDE